jgi:hypothetical protein
MQFCISDRVQSYLGVSGSLTATSKQCRTASRTIMTNDEEYSNTMCANNKEPPMPASQYIPAECYAKIMHVDFVTSHSAQSVFIAHNRSLHVYS